MASIISEVTEIFLQEVAINKTKCMRVIRHEEHEEDNMVLQIKGCIIEEVKVFKYLGVVESADGKMNVEIDKRLM